MGELALVRDEDPDEGQLGAPDAEGDLPLVGAPFGDPGSGPLPKAEESVDSILVVHESSAYD